MDQCNKTDSYFSRISINSDAPKSRVKKTELSIMASVFELITWKMFYFVNNTELINNSRWFNYLNIFELIAREN